MNHSMTIKNEQAGVLLKELREVNKNLRKLLLVIPEESMKEYKDASEIKRAFVRAVKAYPPR